MWKAWNRLCSGTKAVGLSVVLVGAAPATPAQSLTPTHLTDLPPLLQEASGLLRVGSDTWLVLDSGNDHAMYRVSEESGEVLQQVTLSNATNVDWEAISTDGTHVYIADVGNNAGTRTDLRVYRFPSPALPNTASSITVDTIRFRYADQVDFTPLPDGTNWDCEALLAMDDSLFLFTKNWVDGRTDIYVLPALPGDHEAVRRGGFDTQGLITGASYDPVSERVALLGYTELGMEPFVWILSDFAASDLFSGQHVRHELLTGPLQAEAVVWSAMGEVILANEWSEGHDQALWSVDIPMGSAEMLPQDPGVLVFPVPADRFVKVDGADPQKGARIFDLNGALLAAPTLDTTGAMLLPYLSPGEYVLELTVRSRPTRVPLVITH